MKPIHVLIPIAIFLLTACASQSDLDAANARTAQAQQDVAVAEQRAHDAGARADAVSFQAAGTSDSAVLAILVIGILGLVVILAISAPSIGESHAQARQDRLREFELENERARIMLDAKRLQMQQRQQTQAKQLDRP